jgi:dipeptidyl aminopeptidase/acylaminoacyl peptidase
VSNVKRLDRISSIVSVEQIHLGQQLINTIDPANRSNFRKISRRVFAYRVVYKSQDHNVVGFIVEPKRGKSPLPCIIWNRGGSKDFGVIRPMHLFGKMGDLASRGYILIASQYSGNDGSEGADQMGGSDVHDVLNLYNILRRYTRADIRRVGMYGWSRGGLMTYLALSKVKWIKAAVVGAAPTDQINADKFRPGWSEHQKKMYGGSRKENLKRSPLYWPERLYKKTPILIMHGTADWRVNPLDSIRLATRLYEVKIPFRLVIFEGGDHGLTEFREESNSMTNQWFRKFLSKERIQPKLKPHGK